MIVAEVVLPVIAACIEPPIAEGQAAVAALGGVVVDHVEQHLDAIAVQFTDGRFHFVQDCLRPGFDCLLAGVAVVRGEEVD